MRGLGRRIALGQRHDPLGNIRPQRRNPRGPRIVAQQPVEAFRREPFLPAPNAGFRGAGLAHDLVGADAIGGQKNYLGSPDMLLGAVAVPGRGYRHMVIDEAVFAKNSDSMAAGSMMEIWERSIKPTLYDYGGKALVCSNAAGKNLDNFFYRICTELQYGFREYHATTMDNPLLPMHHVRGQRDAARSCVIILLSLKAGLRAAEIAKLEWQMVLFGAGPAQSVVW